MSIIKCPECGHQISDKAPTCPNCGVEIAGKIIRCRECGEVYLDDEDLCPHCHCPATNQHTIIETRDIKHENNTNIPAAPAASALASTAFTNEKEKPAAKIADKNETTARPTEQPAAQRKNKKSSKSALLISFVIALIIFGGCYYWYSEAQEKKETEEFNFAVNSNDPLILQGFLDTYKGASPARRDTIMAKLQMIKQGYQEWTNAVVSNSKSALLDYLKNYPNSEHRAEALEKIDSIDWAQASSLNTAEAYNEYITEHPDGNYRDEADELLRKIQQQTVTPEEKSIISNVFHQFFVSINSRNADNLTATIADNLTLLNKENATKDDVVEMMNKMYKADMTEMTWKLPGNYDIKKRDVEGTRFDYIVSFLANQDVVYSDASQNTTNKYRINAEVNSDGKIKLFKMTKIVE